MIDIDEATNLADEDWEISEEVRAPVKYVKEAVNYVADDSGYDVGAWKELDPYDNFSSTDKDRKEIIAIINGSWGCKGLVRIEHVGFSNSELPEYATRLTYARGLEGMFGGREEPQQFFDKVNRYLESSQAKIEAEEEEMAELLGTEPEEAVDWVCNNGK